MQFANVFRTKSVYPHSICPEPLFKRVSNGLGVPCVCVFVCSQFRMVPEPSQPKVTPNLYPPGRRLILGPLHMLCSHGWGEVSMSVRLLVYARRAAEGRHGSVLLQADSLLSRGASSVRVPAGRLFYYQETHLMTLLSSFFSPSPFLLLGKSMCPGCTVSSPYLRLFVPTLQLPSGLCENTRLFQRHGNKKEMGLVWVSDWVRACVCVCGTLKHYKVVTFTIASSTRTSSPPWCLREFQSTCRFLSLCFWFPFIGIFSHWSRFIFRKEHKWTYSFEKHCFSSNTLHHDVVCTVETSLAKLFVTDILDFPIHL